MKQKVFYLFVMLCFAQTMMAQLTSLGLVKESDATTSRVTGYDNYIPEISFVGDYLYVGTPKGVYRNLYKSGAEWEKLPLTDDQVLDFEVRGDTLIVLTPKQLLCSWDGGNTVKQYPITGITGKEGSDVLQGMGVHPHDATHIFVGTNWSGLWRTRDGGSLWEEIIPDGYRMALLDRIYFNPHDDNKLIGISNVKTLDFVEFYYSTDGGSQWTNSKGDYTDGNIAKGYNVAFHPTKANRMVACGTGIYALSDDAGVSWNAVFDPKGNPDYWPLAAHISDAVYDTRNPEILYGADWTAVGSGATTVCRSTDGGYTWDKFISDTIASKGHVLSLDMKDNILALYTYGNGIYLLDVDAVEKPKEEPKLFSKDTKWYGSIVEYYWGRPSRYNDDLTYHIGADTITDKGFGQNLYRNDEYWGTLITKGEQVWLYPSKALLREGWYFYEFTEPFLLYDFSLQPNDTLFYTWDAVGFSRERPEDEYFQYMVVKNVFHTHGRKVIEFNEGYRWAEGIGCLGGPILNLWRPMTTNGDGIIEEINRVEANGQVIYSNGEFVNPNIESWLKAGMEWTENKQYTKDGDIVTRKVTISEGDTPGFYKVSSNDSKYKLPFTRLQVTNNKVYGHGLGDVFLLYDFSLKVGDKISLLKYYCQGVYHNIYEYDKCYVTKVDTAVYNGVPLKRITLSGDREDVWVEGIGSLTRVFPIDAVDDERSVNAIFSEVVECTYNGETLYHKSFAPADQKGYGIYRGNSFLEAYTLDETKEVTDSTDFARWNDKTVLYFDVDTIGQNAFTGATLRQGQILYFTERLNTIFKDAFTGINILCRTSQEAQFTDDLTLVFEGTNAPNIDKSHIMDYADSTHRINIAVPDIEAYVAKDLQWTYANLMTIDDLLRGYISPENEVVVSDSASVDLEVDVVDDTNMDAGGGVVVRATARPKKDIPVRIGDSNGGDIYSRAPAWMRYTVEIKITDSKGGTLYTEKKQCSAYEECHFETTLTSFPEDGIVYVYSRSIDQYGNASDWTMRRIHLMGIDNIAVPESHSPYYDLTGRKVTLPTRGIYIKDGRKVIVHE